jgi:hypothetical protein
MKGCVLFGRFRFADPCKNRPKKKQADNETATQRNDDEKQ